MERKNGFSSLDPFCLEKESKNKIREKLRRKKDLEEFRKESDRLYQVGQVKLTVFFVLFYLSIFSEGGSPPKDITRKKTEKWEKVIARK